MIRSLQIATFTNTGQYRRRNEDSLLVGGQVLAGLSMATPQSFFFDSVPVLLAVADGIGGSIAGDVASREVMQQLAIPPCPDGKHALYERISSLKTFLDHLVRKNPGLFGMGTTLAGVLCKSDELIIFSCGDSRVYLALPERNTAAHDQRSFNDPGDDRSWNTHRKGSTFASTRACHYILPVRREKPQCP